MFYGIYTGLVTVLAALALVVVLWQHVDLTVERAAYDASRKTIDSLFVERDAIVALISDDVGKSVAVGHLPDVIELVIEDCRKSRESAQRDHRALSARYASACSDWREMRDARLVMRSERDAAQAALEEVRAERDAANERADALAAKWSQAKTSLNVVASYSVDAVKRIEGAS